MISYWGIDHGESVSKADDKYGGHGAPTAGRRALGYFGYGIHGAVAGQKGKRLRSAGNEIAGTAGGAYGANAVGRGIQAATKGKVKIATPLGIAGGVAGSTAGVNRNQRRGYYKPQLPGDR